MTAVEADARLTAPDFRRHARAAAVRSNRTSAWNGLATGTAKVDSTNGCHFVQRSGSFDPVAMEQALALVAARHPVLSARIEAREGAPWLVAHPPTVEFRRTRLPPAAPEASDALAAEALAKEIWRPFDLEQAGLWRAFAFKAARDDYRWGMVVHHFVVDRIGLRILAGEVAQAYRACLAREPLALAPVELAYEDYLASMEEWIQTAEGRRQRDWWRGQLRLLPAIQAPPPPPDGAAREYFEIDAETTALARACARQTKTTIFVVLLAAQMLTLAPFSASGRLAVKVVTDGRDSARLRSVVGNLADRLFLLVDLAGVGDFASLVRAVHEAWLLARRHAFVRFDTVQADAVAAGGSIVAPVFNFHPGGALGGVGGGRPGGAAAYPRPQSQTRPGFESGPYWLEMHDRGAVLTGHVRHGQEQHVPDFLGVFASSLAAGCGRPHAPLSSLVDQGD